MILTHFRCSSWYAYNFCTIHLAGALSRAGYEDLNGLVYKLHTTGQEFWKAKRICASEGAQLVQKITPESRTVIEPLMEENTNWIGETASISISWSLTHVNILVYCIKKKKNPKFWLVVGLMKWLNSPKILYRTTYR